MTSKVFNVLDLEWSCYPDNVFPAGERKEIIEIGLTTVNFSKRTIMQSLSFPVIPTRSTISAYCTELTGWTEAALKRQGMPLAEALRRLSVKHGAFNRLLIVDANDELDSLRGECLLNGLVCPFGNGYFNVSTLFSLLTGEMRNHSLSEKLRIMGLTFEGRLHSGKDDSYNIARLLLALVEKAKFVPDILAK